MNSAVRMGMDGMERAGRDTPPQKIGAGVVRSLPSCSCNLGVIPKDSFREWVGIGKGGARGGETWT
jgi:hypothetical protein